MNIGIVDDENRFLDEFRDIILNVAKNIELEVNVCCFNDGEKHIEELLKCDLVFFDIEMPSISGFDLAQELGRQRNGQELPLVVFVTSRDNYVYTALSYYPFSFIRKSYVGAEIEKCLIQAKKRIDVLRTSAHLIELNGGKILLSAKDVMYVEKVGNEIAYRGKDSEHKERGTMNKTMKKLENMGFIRIHEGFMVNVEHIAYMESNCVGLSDGRIVPVGRTYRDSAKRSYTEWINRKLRMDMW